MSDLIDLAGQRFGQWLVLAKGSAARNLTRWRCRCDCGSERLVVGINLRRGKSTSCGCADHGPHNHKLTPEQVKAIREDSRAQVEIARAYGVAQSAVSLIKARRRWARL